PGETRARIHAADAHLARLRALPGAPIEAVEVGVAQNRAARPGEAPQGEDRHDLHPRLLDAAGLEEVTEALVHPAAVRVLAARDLGGGHDGEQPTLVEPADRVDRLVEG